MRLALVADADARERLRCIRGIAMHTSVSAVGAANWEELEEVVEGVPVLSLILFAPPFPGAPEDAVDRLLVRSRRLVIATTEDMESSQRAPGSGLMHVRRPISEEMLVVLARGAGTTSASQRISFATVDFLQMICMTGDSHTLIVSAEGVEVGVIEVRDGRVWTAFDALGVGEEAFARLVRPEMRARVRSVGPSRMERTIHKDLAEIVLDALRRIDEGTVPPPPPLAREKLQDALASPEEVATLLKDLTTEARRLMMERAYNGAAHTLIRISELDPNSALVRANLGQLRKLGYPR